MAEAPADAHLDVLDLRRGERRKEQKDGNLDEAHGNPPLSTSPLDRLTHVKLASLAQVFIM